MLFAAPGSHVHERARRELGHVAHDRNQRVVMFRSDRDDLRAEAGHEVTHECERIGVGGGRRGEDPSRAHEHLGVGTVEAVLFGPGHGVTAHEAHGKGGLSRAHGVDHRGLDRPDIGDGEGAGSERGTDHLGGATDRDRDHDEIGPGHRAEQIGRDGVERADPQRVRGAVGVGVEAADFVATGACREPDRAANESRPEDGDA